MMEIQKLVRFNDWWKTGDVPKDLLGILAFCKKFGLKKGIVVTRDLFKKGEINGKEILFIPAWLFLLSMKS